MKILDFQGLKHNFLAVSTTHSMLRTKMNLFSLPCPKLPKMIVIGSREPENAFRKISYRRPPLHKIFKNCQIYPVFDFLAKNDKIWVINWSYLVAFGQKIEKRQNLTVFENFMKWGAQITDFSDCIFWLPRPCLLYTSPSPRDRTRSRMPSSA